MSLESCTVQWFGSSSGETYRNLKNPSDNSTSPAETLGMEASEIHNSSSPAEDLGMEASEFQNACSPAGDLGTWKLQSFTVQLEQVVFLSIWKL